jgi:hypothetical protein
MSALRRFETSPYLRRKPISGVADFVMLFGYQAADAVTTSTGGFPSPPTRQNRTLDWGYASVRKSESKRPQRANSGHSAGPRRTGQSRLEGGVPSRSQYGRNRQFRTILASHRRMEIGLPRRGLADDTRRRDGDSLFDSIPRPRAASGNARYVKSRCNVQILCISPDLTPFFRVASFLTSERDFIAAAARRRDRGERGRNRWQTVDFRLIRSLRNSEMP